MSKLDVSRALPSLSAEKVDALLQRLRECGVNDQNDAKYLKETDLTTGGFLNPVEARKLIEFCNNHDNLSEGSLLQNGVLERAETGNNQSLGNNAINSGAIVQSNEGQVGGDHANFSQRIEGPAQVGGNNAKFYKIEKAYFYAEPRISEPLIPPAIAPRSDATTGDAITGQNSVSDMVDYQICSFREAEKPDMRQRVLNNMLNIEEIYLKYLNTLLLSMKPLMAIVATSQPVKSAQDFDYIFYRVPELHNLHANFYSALKSKLNPYSDDTCVGVLFKKLIKQLDFYKDYLNNYERAQRSVEKCARENSRFAIFIEKMTVKSTSKVSAEVITLIELLHKPVERVMQTTLVLQDLLKYTPHPHPDYQVLTEVLREAQNFLDQINRSSSSQLKRAPSSAIAAAKFADRQLIKRGVMVEPSDLRGDKELLTGFLYIKIWSGKGFLSACNPYCVLEIDSYGQFHIRARTRLCRGTKTPDWNEEYEISVKGASAVQLLCYDGVKSASASAGYDGDVLIAKGKIQLVPEFLREQGKLVEKFVLMSGISIGISIKFFPSLLTSTSMT